MAVLIDGVYYVAPGMALINKTTGQPMTEEEYMNF